MSDPTPPDDSTKSFAETCEITTIDKSSLATTAQKLKTDSSEECHAKGRLAAEFRPNAMVFSSASRAPLKPSMGVHMRDPEDPTATISVIADERKGQLISNDTKGGVTTFSPIIPNGLSNGPTK